MKKTYMKPHCYVVLVENTIMQGFSTETTKAGDDSGKTVSNGPEGGNQNDVPECSKKGFYDDWGGNAYNWD